jgi:hypothetical protein
MYLFSTASAVCLVLESIKHTLLRGSPPTKRAWGRNPTLLVSVPVLELCSAWHAWLFDLCVGKGKIKPRKVKAKAGLHMNWREYIPIGRNVNLRDLQEGDSGYSIRARLPHRLVNLHGKHTLYCEIVSNHTLLRVISLKVSHEPEHRNKWIIEILRAGQGGGFR